MSGLYKEGFLFVKICNTSQLTTHAEWNRRWIQLYNNGTLKCYDSCFANHLVFRHDLISLHVSADDLVYPDGVSGKPWIISVGLKERGEKLLLEADCEECMERWAESMTQSLTTNSMNEGESPVYYELMESPVEDKSKGQLLLFTCPTATLDLTSHQGSTTVHNEYEIEDILTPVSNLNEVFSFGELNQESLSSEMSSECVFKSLIKSLNPEGSSNEYEIEDLYSTQAFSDKGTTIPTIDRKSRFAVYVKSVRKSLRSSSLSSVAPAKKETSPAAGTDSKADRFTTLPNHKLSKKIPSFHRYYEILSDSKSVSSMDSLDVQSVYELDNVYETVNEINILRGNSMLIESRRRQAFTRSWSEESLDGLLNASLCGQYSYVPGVGGIIPSSDEVNFLASLPNYHKLLSNFWLMSFILPSGKVYKQLIDITLPIQTSLQPLLDCFQCTSTQLYNSFLSLQVIGDLYQTYNSQKPPRVDKKKGAQSLSWDKSFSSQGIVTSKILRLIMRVSEDFKLNTEKLNDFLYGISHLTDTESFCMSWVSFVKGNFPVMDISVSARHSASIFLIYSRTRNYSCPEVKDFVPSHLQRATWFLQSVAKETEKMSSYSVHSLCQKFLMDVKASQSGNAIALSAKKVTISRQKIKHDPCILTIGSKHLGVVNGMYSQRLPNPTSVYYSYRDIQGWFLNQSLNILTLKLHKGTEGTDNVIIKSNSLVTIDLLLKDFFQVAPFYHK